MVPPSDGDEEGLSGLEDDLELRGFVEEREFVVIGLLGIDSAVDADVVVDPWGFKGRDEDDGLASVDLRQQDVHGVVVEWGNGASRAEPEKHARSEERRV